MKSNVRSDTIKEIKTGIHVSFDYFKCTFPLIVRKAELEKTEMNRTIKEIAAFFNIDSKEIGDSYYVPRYKEAYTLGEAIDIRLGGPEFGNGFESCYIELKGQGCKEYEVRCPEKTWDDLLIYFVLRLEGRIKRIDIAIDDYEEKEITFNELLSKLENIIYFIYAVYPYLNIADDNVEIIDDEEESKLEKDYPFNGKQKRNMGSIDDYYLKQKYVPEWDEECESVLDFGYRDDDDYVE